MGIKFTIITYHFRQVIGKVGFIYKFLLKSKIITLPKSETRYRTMYYLNGNVKKFRRKKLIILSNHSLKLIDIWKQYLFLLLCLPLSFAIVDRSIPALLVTESLIECCIDQNAACFEWGRGRS